MNIESVLNARDKQIYDEEFRDWLPRKIFDAHVHLFDHTNFPPEYVMPEKSCFRKFNGTLTLEQYQQITKLLLPEQEVGALCFGAPDREADLAAADKYTGSIVDNRQAFGMTLLSPKENIEEVKRRVNAFQLVGYKPYRNFVDWMDYDDVTIFDMLNDEQMAFADEQGLAVTLHIPRAERLSDSVNQRQMVEICHRYPNAKIIFAHIGRAYFMRNVIGYLDGIAECPNAYIDTAMVSHPGVLEYAFNNFPREKIIFGSDAPIAFLRGKSVEINHQYAYLMGEDYRIGSAIFDVDHVVDFTTFLYEQLRGTKEAAAKAGFTAAELQDYFYNNAFNLFSAIAGRIK